MDLRAALVRMPLARQIFLVASTVLVAVTAVLALAPVRVSSPPGAADLATVLGHIEAVQPELVIVDSVQTMVAGDTDGVIGGVTQVRAVTAALTAAVAPLGFPIQSLIGILILCIIATELLLRRRSAYPLRYFALSFLLLSAGAACSVIDVSRRMCEPSNHLLQGHAVWHVLSALSLLAAFVHYRQFDAQLDKAG